jgi:N-acylneuraminate cytidylyltransferase
MIGGKSVLAVIAARGGSKGLPRKHLLDLGGRPVVAWSVEAAKGSALVDRLVLSTDDQEIADAAALAGCEVPFLRPAELSTDTVPLGPVLLHALDSLGAYDYLVLLQATSPLRLASDIDACIRLCHDSGAPAALSVCVAPKSPFWMATLDVDGRMHPVVPAPADAQRQQLPTAYVPNGAVYVARAQAFRQQLGFTFPDTRAYVMPAERSVDIDYQLDLVMARALVAERT